MTETTDSRQIRMLVNSVLSKYEIDDLQLEIDLSSAFQRYFMERRKSGDKVGIRQSILKDMKIAAKNADVREKMQTRVKAALGFNVDGSRFDGMIDFLIKEEENGKTIEDFRAWWDKQDKYKRFALWKISDRPDFLSEQWPNMSTDKQAQDAVDVNEMFPTL